MIKNLLISLLLCWMFVFWPLSTWEYLVYYKCSGSEQCYYVFDSLSTLGSWAARNPEKQIMKIFKKRVVLEVIEHPTDYQD